jgi:hypothetical protein
MRQALENPESVISYFAHDWREYLFPEADDGRFADAYAQTRTYAQTLTYYLLLSQTLTYYLLLSQALTLLADPQARAELATGVGMLERTISAVDSAELTRKDANPWLYFYGDFLAAYHKKLRNDSGVYYAPVEVVWAEEWTNRTASSCLNSGE